MIDERLILFRKIGFIRALQKNLEDNFINHTLLNCNSAVFNSIKPKLLEWYSEDVEFIEYGRDIDEIYFKEGSRNYDTALSRRMDSAQIKEFRWVCPFEKW